jgi:hypothetical protein
VDTLVESLFNAMHEQLKKSSRMLAFVQARVSAESFVRNECALAACDLLDPQRYRLEMERRHQGKTIDLLIHETEDGIHKKEPAYQFELKMAWPSGLPGNAAGVKHDLDALQGRNNAWALVLFFAFETADEGVRYQPTGVGLEEGLGKFVEQVNAGPLQWIGPPFPMLFGKSVGKACLMAWPPATPP